MRRRWTALWRRRTARRRNAKFTPTLRGAGRSVYSPTSRSEPNTPRAMRMGRKSAPRLAAARPGVRLAADIGGTFTDIAVFDDRSGKLVFGKALSTPGRLVEGISAGMEKAGSNYASAALFLHGSTVAINTVLERTGARTAL